MKNVRIPSFFWSVVSVFYLNTEIYRLNLGIWSKYEKIQTINAEYEYISDSTADFSHIEFYKFLVRNLQIISGPI